MGKRKGPLHFDPLLVQPNARFQRNRREYKNSEFPRFVIVDRVETLQGPGGEFKVVHYRCESTGRSSTKLLRDFCRYSDFIPAPLPVEEPPKPTEESAPAIDRPEDTSTEGRLATLEAGQKEIQHHVKHGMEMLKEVLDILRRAELGPLFNRK